MGIRCRTHSPDSDGLRVRSKHVATAVDLLLAAALAGCDSAPPPDTAVAARVHRIDWRVGDDPSEEATSFGRVSGLARDDGGRLFVADDRNHRVAVFNAAGELRYTIGRQGAGPGEMPNPCCLAVDPSGRLRVRDGGNRRCWLRPAGVERAYRA